MKPIHDILITDPKNYRKPKFLESLKAVLTEEGLVSFECKVVGYPTPNLSWFKDGQELKPGDVYQLTGTNSLGNIFPIPSQIRVLGRENLKGRRY